jgi:hypothetical protein
MGLYYGAQYSDVFILDVSPVSTQMHCNSACPREIGENSSSGNARLPGAPRLSDRRNVIDVYVQPYSHQQPSVWFEETPSTLTISALDASALDSPPLCMRSCTNLAIHKIIVLVTIERCFSPE